MPGVACLYSWLSLSLAALSHIILLNKLCWTRSARQHALKRGDYYHFSSSFIWLPRRVDWWMGYTIGQMWLLVGDSCGVQRYSQIGCYGRITVIPNNWLVSHCSYLETQEKINCAVDIFHEFVDLYTCCPATSIIQSAVDLHCKKWCVLEGCWDNCLNLTPLKVFSTT